MPKSLIIMGVAGCGKSSLGAAVAQDLGWPLLEGDDLHSAQSVAKMRQGIPLTDEDRAGWLDRIAASIAQAATGQVVTCSALKRAYRDRLRAADANLRFVFLDVDAQEAQRRVAARASHFFSSQLVDSQFATLERPTDEAGVLTMDASWPLADLRAQVGAWLHLEVPA